MFKVYTLGQLLFIILNIETLRTAQCGVLCDLTISHLDIVLFHQCSCIPSSCIPFKVNVDSKPVQHRFNTHSLSSHTHLHSSNTHLPNSNTYSPSSNTQSPRLHIRSPSQGQRASQPGCLSSACTFLLPTLVFHFIY